MATSQRERRLQLCQSKWAPRKLSHLLVAFVDVADFDRVLARYSVCRGPITSTSFAKWPNLLSYRPLMGPSGMKMALALCAGECRENEVCSVR